MDFALTFGTAFALAMDAFAVSVCMGIDLHDFRAKHALTLGGYFGFFQFIMPVIGYYLGAGVRSAIEKYDHWLAFALLVFIGVKMIIETFEDKGECPASMETKTMLTLAVATSIDALIVGVTMGITGAGIWLPAAVIGVVAFALSALGGFIGRRIGCAFGRWANLAGGAILIAIGANTLISHLS